ncbi:UNVERIFIED_CONTAM: hypothetical protein FKN15_070759 [Acipenser sinensis]
MRTGSAATLSQPFPISTGGEAGQALEADEGHNGPECTDGPGPGVFGGAPPAPVPIPAPVSLTGVQSELESSVRMAEEEDVLLIAASWNEDSFSTEMEEGEEPAHSTEAQPSSEDASEPSAPPFSSSPPSALPSVRRFHEGGADKLGLAGFPPVDSTIVALVKAPPVGSLPKDPVCLNLQCRVTETHLKSAYATEAQMTRLTNTLSILTAYMDGILREAPLPEPVACELRLLSGMLLQISGLQGQALGRSPASLVVARRQLWLSQARLPDADKTALLDTLISLGHTFGPAVDEILQ